MKGGCDCLYGIRALVSCDQHLKLRPGVNQSELGLIFQLFSFPIKRFRSADFEFKILNLDIVFSFGLCMKCEMSIMPAIQSVRSAVKQKNLSFSFSIQVVLSCQVSWIRLSDLKLLTVGRYTYTTDLRFEGLHQKYSPDWKLVLTKARLEDSGKPPIM